MRISARFILANVILVSLAIIATAYFTLNQVRADAERYAIRDQEQRIGTFWELLKAKGTVYRIIDGKMLAGDYVINGNYELPDKVRAIFGGTATIFMGDVRVSTNVQKKDGTRAIGTRLQGPAHDAIFLHDKPYRGEAPILGEMYYTAYDPIRDPDGKTIGVLYTGVKKSDYFTLYESLKRKVIIISAALVLLFVGFAIVALYRLREIEEELLLRHSQNKAIINNNPDMAWLKDREGRFILVNHAFEKACGLSSEQLAGRTDYDIWPMHLAEQYRNDDQEVMDSGTSRWIDEPLVDSTGRRTWVETIKTPVVSEKGEIIGITGTARNITERKLAEESLQASEQRFRAFFYDAADAMFIHDRNGSILDVNRRFEETYGYSRDELIEMNISEILDPGVLVNLSDRLERIFSEGSHFFESLHRRRDGSSFPVEVNCRAVITVGRGEALSINRDISERRKVDKALRLTQSSMDRAADSIFWVTSDARIIYANDAACSLRGYSREELLGMTLPELDPHYPAEQWPIHWEELKRAGSMRFETENRTKDGRLIPVEVQANFIIYGEDEFNCAFVQDISDRKSLEAQLRQAQKMESIGTLAGGVAHDFNNILSVIMGCGAIIQMKAGEDAAMQKAVNFIMDAAERAAALTHSLLAFSRKKAGEQKAEDVNIIVMTMKQFLRRVIGEDIILRAELASAPLVALLDRSQLEQILINLATNARDAMQAGGTLAIATSLRQLNEAEAREHGCQPGPYVAISVRDTGSGIDNLIRDRIFDPFFTTKEVGKGTGLGLSLVYGIVKQHGGFITVASEVKQGTDITIHFPQVEDSAALNRQLSTELPRGSETLLLAEDDSTVRETNRAILEEFGYKVHAARDGEEAMGLFHEHRGEISLAILDVIMPKKNGRLVYEEMKQTDPNINVIFCSGYTADIINQKGGLGEEVVVLSKPLSATSLLLQVRKALDSAKERGAEPPR